MPDQTKIRAGRDASSPHSMPRLFRQPRSSQALFVSRDVFRPPVRSHCIPQIGNAPRGVELPQSCQRFLCLLEPPRERVACGGDAQCIEVIGPVP